MVLIVSIVDLIVSIVDPKLSLLSYFNSLAARRVIDCERTLSPLSFFAISRRGLVVFFVLLLRIQQSKHKRAQRCTWLFLLLSRLYYVQAKLSFVRCALCWVSQLRVHLFPCVAKARLRLLLCLSRIVHAVGVIHADAV